MNEVKQAVGNWRVIANNIGISSAAQELKASAFLVGEIGNNH